MGIKNNRVKPYNFLSSVIYRLSRLIVLPDKVKFRIFSDLEWIFDRLAHEYSVKLIEKDLHPMKKGMYEFLENKISPEYSMLDFGCSHGVISCWLSNLCKSVVGVDSDCSQIEYGKKINTNDNVFLVCDDGIDLMNSGKYSFDVLVCAHVLEHLDNPEELLIDAKRHFRYIYIEVPDFESSYLNISKSLLGVGINYTDYDHVHEFDREELEKQIMNLDMKILDAEFRHGVMRFWIEV